MDQKKDKINRVPRKKKEKIERIPKKKKETKNNKQNNENKEKPKKKILNEYELLEKKWKKKEKFYYKVKDKREQAFLLMADESKRINVKQLISYLKYYSNQNNQKKEKINIIKFGLKKVNLSFVPEKQIK